MQRFFGEGDMNGEIWCIYIYIVFCFFKHVAKYLQYSV